MHWVPNHLGQRTRGLLSTMMPCRVHASPADKHGLTLLRIGRLRCSSATSYAHGLPPGLFMLRSLASRSACTPTQTYTQFHTQVARFQNSRKAGVMADPPGIGPRKPRSRRDNLERRGHSTRPGGGIGTRARASRNILKFLPHLLASRPARSPVRIPQQTLLTARSEPFEPRASDGISATRVPCITVVHLLVRMTSQTVGFAAPSLADHVLFSADSRVTCFVASKHDATFSAMLPMV